MKNLFLTASFLGLLGAFDNATGWKLDDAGHIVLKDGNPVFLGTDGSEMTVGGDTIRNINKENKTVRERAEAAESKLKIFEGIDPAKAKEAIETVKNIDLKKLVDSGKLDEVKNEITAQFTAQMKEKDTANFSLQERIDGMLVGNVFNGSEFVRDGIAVPRDMFEDSFRKYFKVEDGKVVAYGKDGNRIFSKQKVGEHADPEEALQILVETHPQKDTILKANIGSGSGNEGGGGNRGTGKVMKRGEFEKLNPTQQSEYMGKVNKGEMKLVD